uniref:Putative ovule protein n=1 Tax=Solanum chacoense TaxID=4108 RepID=A0A0V0GWM9_SOLCH
MAFPLLYPTYLFHLVTHKLPSMNVGRKQWRKNFWLLKKMTQGTLFHVLQMSALLDVNGFIQSNFILMDLLIGIKLDWLFLVTDKSMGWTMRRLLHP